MNIKLEHFNILRKIFKDSYLSQRQIAKELNLSLGKVNYCIVELKKRGLIKIKNFKKNKNKSNYMYLLTPKGFSEKSKITLKFMKLKIKEYEELQKELDEKK
jgi:EPS-associated MarR family transcriptional regulator